MKVNLLNWRQRALRHQMIRWGGLSASRVLLIAVVLLLWWQSLAGNTRQWRQQAALRAEARQQAYQLLQRRAASQEQAQRLEQRMAQRLRRREQLVEWQTLMSQLETNVPDELWLSTITHQQHALRIEGISQRPEATRLLHHRLNSLPFLQPWLSGGLQKNADGLYRFTLSAGKTGEAKNER